MAQFSAAEHGGRTKIFEHDAHFSGRKSTPKTFNTKINIFRHVPQKKFSATKIKMANISKNLILSTSIETTNKTF